jgi:hypothetical protein
MTIKKDKKPRRVDHDGYGKTKILKIEKISGNKSISIQSSCGSEDFDGLKISTYYGGEFVNYYVTESWMNGRMMRIDVAYRIFEESEKFMSVGLVKDYSEFESIKIGLEIQMMRVAGMLRF